MYEHGKNRQSVQSIIYIHIYSVKFFAKFACFAGNMKKCLGIIQIFKYYAYFLLILHYFLHFYSNIPVFAIITQKRADDDGKSKNSLRRGAAHTFPPPRLEFFCFPNIPPPPLGLLFVSVPLATFFDFILNFCYNIYIKQRK